jgi:hypothetical protein
MYNIDPWKARGPFVFRRLAHPPLKLWVGKKKIKNAAWTDREFRDSHSFINVCLSDTLGYYSSIPFFKRFRRAAASQKMSICCRYKFQRSKGDNAKGPSGCFGFFARVFAELISLRIESTKRNNKTIIYFSTITCTYVRENLTALQNCFLDNIERPVLINWNYDRLWLW